MVWKRFPKPPESPCSDSRFLIYSTRRDATSAYVSIFGTRRTNPMESALRRVLHDLDRDAAPRFLKSNPQALEEAIELAISGEPSTAWRAAWHLQAVIEENDPRLQPHVLRIIQALPDKNDGHQRELLKILLQMDLDEEQESLLFDQCLSIWESIKKQPSVRSLALKTIVRIARKYPDLSREVSFLTRDHYLQTLSPAIRKSVVRMIDDLTAADDRPGKGARLL